MKKTVIVFSLVFLGVCLGFSVIKLITLNIPEPAFHEHADFAVFINGAKFDFTQDKYMTDTACKVVAIPTALAHEGEDRSDDVHLHDGNGDTVHVHAQGVLWSDFFNSLKMSLTDNAFIDDQGNIYANNSTHEIVFLVNGVIDPHLSTREIRNFDRVLISYGPKNRINEIWAEYGQVANRACEQSGGCEHRGVDVVESCGSYVARPWLINILGL